ncbi:MAG: PKD domain-containing protein, partial [Bacteroidota bacterium]
MFSLSAAIRPIGLACCWILVSALFPHTAQSQVIADFTTVAQSGCSPLTVQFFNTASGAINSYFWDFGNGNTSTLPNPGVIYVTPGTYTVSLTVSDGTSSDTETKVAYITVFADPAADFTSDVQGGCAPLTVGFSDISTLGDAPINNWSWDFGDGNISSAQNPTHTYGVAGSYDVTLVVSDTNGCSATLSQPDFITASTPPAAGFSFVQNDPCNNPEVVSFTSTVVPAGSYNYFWVFGDGNFSSLAS